MGRNGRNVWSVRHDSLLNRDDPDAHPIDAITGLREALVGADGIVQWDVTKSYSAGTYVGYGSSLYKALQAVPAGTAITDTNYWLVIGGGGAAGSNDYGTCATAAGTAAKVVTLPGFALYTGSIIAVDFTNTNTAANPTLNVNGTGAKPVFFRGKQVTGNGSLLAGITHMFAYDGTNWKLINANAFENIEGDVTLYVRVDGNDNNTGFTNDAQGALRTCAGAIRRSKNLSVSGSLTWAFQAGSFAGSALTGKQFHGSGDSSLTITGIAGATSITGAVYLSNTFVEVQNIIFTGGIYVETNAVVLFNGCTFYIVYIRQTAFAEIRNAVFTGTTGVDSRPAIALTYSSTCVLAGSITFNNRHSVGITCLYASSVYVLTGTTITYSNTVFTAGGFLDIGYSLAGSNTAIFVSLPTFVGTFTGAKYNIGSCGRIIGLTRAELDSIPGSAPGTLTAGNDRVITAQMATQAPLTLGTAAVGTSNLAARQDHVHPRNTVPRVIPLAPATIDVSQGELLEFMDGDNSILLLATKNVIGVNLDTVNIDDYILFSKAASGDNYAHKIQTQALVHLAYDSGANINTITFATPALANSSYADIRLEESGTRIGSLFIDHTMVDIRNDSGTSVKKLWDGTNWSTVTTPFTLGLLTFTWNPAPIPNPVGGWLSITNGNITTSPDSMGSTTGDNFNATAYGDVTVDFSDFSHVVGAQSGDILGIDQATKKPTVIPSAANKQDQLKASNATANLAGGTAIYSKAEVDSLVSASGGSGTIGVYAYGETATSTTAPTPSPAGMKLFDFQANQLFVSNGTTWVSTGTPLVPAAGNRIDILKWLDGTSATNVAMVGLDGYAIFSDGAWVFFCDSAGGSVAFGATMQTEAGGEYNVKNAVIPSVVMEDYTKFTTNTSIPFLDFVSNIISKINGLKTQIDAKANSNDVVSRTGNQAVDGTKTFSTAPVLPSVSTLPVPASATKPATEAQAASARILPQLTVEAQSYINEVMTQLTNLGLTTTRVITAHLHGSHSMNFGLPNGSYVVTFFRNGTSLNMLAESVITGASYVCFNYSSTTVKPVWTVLSKNTLPILEVAAGDYINELMTKLGNLGLASSSTLTVQVTDTYATNLGLPTSTYYAVTCYRAGTSSGYLCMIAQEMVSGAAYFSGVYSSISAKPTWTNAHGTKLMAFGVNDYFTGIKNKIIAAGAVDNINGIRAYVIGPDLGIPSPYGCLVEFWLSNNILYMSATDFVSGARWRSTSYTSLTAKPTWQLVGSSHAFITLPASDTYNALRSQLSAIGIDDANTTGTFCIQDGTNLGLNNARYTVEVWRGASNLYMKAINWYTGDEYTSLGYYGGTDKPVWTLPSWAHLNSPAFTGTPTAPTATAETNTAQLATTAFVHLVKKAGYGICDTAAATAVKVVTTTEPAVAVGRVVAVKFNYANTATNVSLQVNNVMLSVYYQGTRVTGAGRLGAGIHLFIYNGSQWELLNPVVS